MLYFQNILKKASKFLRNTISYIFCLIRVWISNLSDDTPVYTVKSLKADSLFFSGGLNCSTPENMTRILRAMISAVKANPVVTYTKGKHARSFPQKGVLDIRLHDDVIIELKRGKVGITLFKPGDKLTMYEILKRRKRLEKYGAKIQIAYFYNMKQGPNTYMKSLKTIGRCGYGAVIGLHPFVETSKRQRAYNLKNTYIFSALGDIIDKPKGMKRAALRKANKNAVILEFGFDFKHKNISKQRYYPINITNFHKEFPDIILCRRKSERKNNISAYNKAKANMKSFHAFDDDLDIRTLFNWIGADIPKRWEYLLDYSCGSICTRTFEIAPGNVFFYRPQFHDKNDVQQSELLRLRLVFRAVVRKSLFIFSYKKLPSFIPHVVLKDINEAHIKCIAEYRKRLKTTFIGITGSIGKTSTKDMLYQVMSQAFKTEKSIHNNNVQVHIGLKMQTIKVGTEYFIQEIGGGRPGGASRHSRMILPRVAMVTNIGTAHIGNYSSQYELMLNKLGIADGLDSNGFLALNYDDELLKNAKPNCRVVSYAVENHNADYYADDIKVENNGMTFDIVSKHLRCPVKLNVLGVHNVLNAVGCFAVGYELGLSPSQIAKGISLFR